MFQILQVMIIWLIKKEIDDVDNDFDAKMSWVLFDVDEFNFFKTIKIFTLNTYEKMMQNSIWRKL